MAEEKVHIVGIGDDGVEGMTAQARRLVEAADVLVGPESCATLVPAAIRGRLVSAANLEELVERIEAAGSKRVVVLASGDPLFYGTARYVCSKLGKDRFEVVPHVSSMQLAFARVKESWEDAFLANLSGQSIERVVDRVRSSETAGLFTSDQWPAPAVARALLDEGVYGLVRPPLLHSAPPLVIDEPTLRDGFARVDRALSVLDKELGF